MSRRHAAQERVHAAWNRRFSNYLVSIEPTAAGRICWDTAAHLFNTGKEPMQAARECAELIRASANDGMPYAWGERYRAEQAAKAEQRAVLRMMEDAGI